MYDIIIWQVRVTTGDVEIQYKLPLHCRATYVIIIYVWSHYICMVYEYITR
jgi:hypothetical protein